MLETAVSIIVVGLVLIFAIWAIRSSNNRLRPANATPATPTTTVTYGFGDIAKKGPLIALYWIIAFIIAIALVKGCLLPQFGVEVQANEIDVDVEVQDEPDVVVVQKKPRLNLSNLDLALNRQGIWEVWSGEVRARTNGDSHKTFGIVIPPRQPPGHVKVTVHGDGEAYMVDQALYKSPQPLLFLRQHAWNGGSDTAYIYRLGKQGYPHKEVWGNRDREVGVYYIQSEGERIFPIRHEYSQPIKHYLVRVNSQGAASFTLPATDWKDVWIVAIDDPAYLSTLDGQAVPPAGLSWDTVGLELANHYQELGFEDFAERAGRELAATRQMVQPEIGYQGLYYQVQGSPAVPLLESKEFAFENSEKGLRITIGLNVPGSAIPVRPARVLVGISQ